MRCRERKRGDLGPFRGGEVKRVVAEAIVWVCLKFVGDEARAHSVPLPPVMRERKAELRHGGPPHLPHKFETHTPIVWTPRCKGGPGVAGLARVG